MTHLRKIMLEELQRRNYSAATIRSYIRTVEDFARHFDCPPDRLGPRQIREYQAELFQKRKLSPGTITVSLAALRFFYTKTLGKAWSVSETPYPKKNDHLPTILSQEEVARLIDAADTHFHRTLLMTLYATGLRRAELVSVAKRKISRQIRRSEAFFVIFFLTSMCGVWHIYSHENKLFRISFRCLALVSESGG